MALMTPGAINAMRDAACLAAMLMHAADGIIASKVRAHQLRVAVTEVADNGLQVAIIQIIHIAFSILT